MYAIRSYYAIASVTIGMPTTAAARPIFAQIRANAPIFSLLFWSVESAGSMDQYAMSFAVQLMPQSTYTTAKYRITSYNVCYTKLLRPADGESYFFESMGYELYRYKDTIYALTLIDDNLVRYEVKNDISYNFV